MNSYVYKFNSQTKNQVSGGAIGLEMTGELAGVFMMWDREMKNKMRNESIDVIMYKRYVDDINSDQSQGGSGRTGCIRCKSS